MKPFTMPRNEILKVSVMVLLLFCPWAYAQDEPSLPAGLSNGQNQEDQPTLPSGLRIESEDTNDIGVEPSLPSGLKIAPSVDEAEAKTKLEQPWMDITGFWEVRSGYRLGNDKHEKDASIGETRLQLEMEKLWKDFTFKVTTDLYYDWVDENHSVDLERGEGFLDLREASVAYSPFDFMD